MGATVSLVNNSNPFFSYTPISVDFEPGASNTVARFENVRYGIYTLRITLPGHNNHLTSDFVIAAPTVSSDLIILTTGAP
jgi:hypothetical protein